MKIVIVLAAVLAAVSGQGYRPSPEEQYAPTPYNFNYVNEGDEGASSHQESGDGAGGVTGSYTVTDQDGRSRVVDYVADAGGFRANVRTNEPGTESAAPADVVFESTAEGAKGPVLRFGNDQYNQPQYGQPQNYNQPQYGQPQNYNRPQYGQPQNYNQPQYGQPQNYNQPQYGQPQNYNRPQYGRSQNYNRPQYVQPQNYNRAQYGQPQNYNRAQYGQPQYGQPQY